jgi:hypothetical protein
MKTSIGNARMFSQKTESMEENMMQNVCAHNKIPQ